MDKWVDVLGQLSIKARSGEDTDLLRKAKEAFEGCKADVQEYKDCEEIAQKFVKQPVPGARSAIFDARRIRAKQFSIIPNRTQTSLQPRAMHE